jgi:SpoIID/LytB domain protein
MRTRTPALAALCAAAIVVAPAVPAADAATKGVPAADPWVSPSSALVVTGQGYGHGRGMSQWGAVNAAIGGADYKTIVQFYYPHTTFSTITTSMRVKITADTDNNTTVKAMKGLRVRDLGNGKTYRLHTTRTPKAWRLKTVRGKTRLYYRTAAWHLYRTGGRVALKGAGEFRSTTGPMTLKMSSGNHRYRGALRFVGSDTVNVLGLEKYLRGVVPAEMPASWRPAALQAQAVAARTYALRKRADASGPYQICDTSACQVYKGYDAEDSRTTAAIAATSGQYLTYGGKPALTEFSSSSGGWTSSGGVAYLPSQKDIYSVTDNDPYVPWADPGEAPVTVSTARLEQRYPSIGTLNRLRIATREGSGDWGGRVVTITLDGDKSDIDISGDTFRSIYGLRSTFFKFGP